MSIIIIFIAENSLLNLQDYLSLCFSIAVSCLPSFRLHSAYTNRLLLSHCVFFVVNFAHTHILPASTFRYWVGHQNEKKYIIIIVITLNDIARICVSERVLLLSITWHFAQHRRLCGFERTTHSLCVVVIYFAFATFESISSNSFMLFTSW